LESGPQAQSPEIQRCDASGGSKEKVSFTILTTFVRLVIQKAKRNDREQASF
jgi:hypothetical protein